MQARVMSSIKHALSVLVGLLWSLCEILCVEGTGQSLAAVRAFVLKNMDFNEYFFSRIFFFPTLENPTLAYVSLFLFCFCFLSKDEFCSEVSSLSQSSQENISWEIVSLSLSKSIHVQLHLYVYIYICTELIHVHLHLYVYIYIHTYTCT